jgi:hypothetical protein
MQITQALHNKKPTLGLVFYKEVVLHTQIMTGTQLKSRVQMQQLKCQQLKQLDNQ